MSITGLPDDMPGGGPVKCGIAISDILAGMYAGVAVLAVGAVQQLAVDALHDGAGRDAEFFSEQEP